VWRLSARLEAILSLLGNAKVLADVGTDHALLPAHAVLRGLVERAYAIDLREEPLLGAARTVAELNVADRVTLIRGSGLQALRGRNVDAAVVAGLSGRTMLSWCRDCPDVLDELPRLVLQPNGHLTALRAWAHNAGLWLLDENICLDGKRFFVSCAFGPGTGPDPAYALAELSLEAAFELGPWLVHRRDPLAAECFADEHARLKELVARGQNRYRTKLEVYEAAQRLLAV